MDIELISALEERIELLLKNFLELRTENNRLTGEVERLLQNRDQLSARIDKIINRLDSL
jgi:FtsZ-binding cell division protein ZapB